MLSSVSRYSVFGFGIRNLISGEKILSSEIELPNIVIDGSITVTNLDIPTPDQQLTQNSVIENWAYDLDKYPLTKGESFDEKVINLSIENILSTLRGERLFNENFGSILPLIEFEQLNYNSAFDLLNSLLVSIRRFEKRITVIKDKIELNIITEENALTLVIPYIVNRTGLENTFNRKIIL